MPIFTFIYNCNEKQLPLFVSRFSPSLFIPHFLRGCCRFFSNLPGLLNRCINNGADLNLTGRVSSAQTKPTKTVSWERDAAGSPAEGPDRVSPLDAGCLLLFSHREAKTTHGVLLSRFEFVCKNVSV